MANEYNFEELCQIMQTKITEGFMCFAKWTCEGCKERVTCSTPNAVFTEGYRHDEKKDGSPCGYISYPDKFGLVIVRVIGDEKLNQELQDKILKECD